MNIQIIFTADSAEACEALGNVITAATEAWKALEEKRTGVVPAAAPLRALPKAEEPTPVKAKKATPKVEAGIPETTFKPVVEEYAPAEVLEAEEVAEEVADAPPVLPAVEESAATAQRITLEMVRLKMKELLDAGKRPAIEKALADRSLKNASALEEPQFASFYQDLLAA